MSLEKFVKGEDFKKVLKESDLATISNMVKNSTRDWDFLDLLELAYNILSIARIRARDIGERDYERKIAVIVDKLDKLGNY